jgi:hypothetical protein
MLSVLMHLYGSSKRLRTSDMSPAAKKLKSLIFYKILLP